VLLQGMTAMSTGGAAGMGRSTALRFAEVGADVIIAGPSTTPNSGTPSASESSTSRTLGFQPRAADDRWRGRVKVLDDRDAEARR
jgi:NAD(P)-dependent dehydrogenase (short-subunit alcohol dehydrogenase family)